ncbi:hypothetical protein [Leifsonia sp. PS1209]|uniref:hypothetical protein n=1 Tax=Leifsonia sp. PS1209 TaxID=2724914 RepID=UPI001442BBD0|nr:hypothetical protein [Leifsonia sp. PS1209]QIZ98982.1 hypothetical protein HF024_11015 [Leifsonia sp. PS1209]
MRFTSLVAAAATAALIALAVPSPASASLTGRASTVDVAVTSTEQLPPEVQSQVDELQANRSRIDAASTNVHGMVTFDFAAALRSGVPNELARDYARGVAIGGGHVVNDNGEFPSQVSARATCRGQNAFWYDWIGYHFKLDSCITPKVVKAIAGTAGVAGVLGALSAAFPPTSLPLVAVGAVAAYSAWSIDQCSKNGTGVEMSLAGFVC